jgi:hypothetical protein
MFYLYGHRGGFELLSQALPDDAMDRLLFNAPQVLAARGGLEAAGLLSTLGFVLIDATNNFNDEFTVLQAQTSLPQYEYLREAIKRPDTPIPSPVMR